MRNTLCKALVALLIASPALAHDDGQPHAHTHAHTHASAGASKPALDKHTLEDIARHQGMAKAHQEAAQCLADGRKHDECMEALRTACKGLALGKSCGLRHAH